LLTLFGRCGTVLQPPRPHERRPARRAWQAHSRRRGVGRRGPGPSGERQCVAARGTPPPAGPGPVAAGVISRRCAL